MAESTTTVLEPGRLVQTPTHEDTSQYFERLERKPTVEEQDAAAMIQRNYRGYRGRRQINGMGLDASTRWIEAVKEAHFRAATSPTSRRQRALSGQANTPAEVARRNWLRIAAIAERIGADDTSDDTDLGPDLDPDDSTAATGTTAAELQARRERRHAAKRERDRHAKMIDLSYYLEMVDVKHRYGSHLRAYHAVWKRADTDENFFYWLDHGEGRRVEVPAVSREKLEADQVRYLSREERLNYLVRIDAAGRLCWAKNGERVSTDLEWRDSVNGIVRRDDEEAPCWKHEELARAESDSTHSGSDGAVVPTGPLTAADAERVKGLKKLTKVNPGVILNHLLQKSVRPGTWIFVADTSFRLYVGIKQAGAFQHSSFLHGSRISAAGLIKLKDGQLRRLSPLSGHYRPPTRNFREFVHSLRDAGADMSRLSISRSYTVLLGLEAYQKSSRKIRSGERRIGHGVGRVMHVEETRRGDDGHAQAEKARVEEKARKQSMNTQAEQVKMEESAGSRRSMSIGERMLRRFSLGMSKGKGKHKVEEQASVDSRQSSGLT